MRKLYFLWLLWMICSFFDIANAQQVGSIADRPIALPTGWFRQMRSQLSGLNHQITRESNQNVQTMARYEARLQQKLSRLDPAAAETLFAGSTRKYAALCRQLAADTGRRGSSLGGTYLPYLDSLQGSLAFLQQNPQYLPTRGTGISSAAMSQLQNAGRQLQALQAKMQDADLIKAYMQQRQQQFARLLSQHTHWQQLLSKPYAGLNKQVYYYSQQLRAYKDIWSNPDPMIGKTLVLLSGVPEFSAFMKNNSMLGGLFRVPGNYGTTQALVGMQTRDQVAQQVQGKLIAGGAAGEAALQSSLQSAGSALDSYKSKLSAFGAGNEDMDMPDFRPNDQRAKTFWRRLVYGTNVQTTRTNYYFPTITDLALSLGYKLGHDNVVGVGASYKLGWGNGIRHIALSSQGVGLRSFLQVKIRASFSATGGFEYNYTTPFTSYQQLRQLQLWTKSGLIGVTKTVSMKTRVFKKTTLSLLWDFLSYQQVPKTQPVLFRVGYTMN
ncbi:hypothetical protein [Puia sp.]|jgi:hypothetical protein|uniref:hypothetical protein n=1 Tax=Puia sp. TaxID=2045100 RepID=UPI002F3E3DBD